MTTTETFPSEFEAFGHKVPTHRLDAGLAAIREMVPSIGTETAMTVIGKVADRIERDEPYKAQREARVVLDETGMYRLLATLMTG